MQVARQTARKAGSQPAWQEGRQSERHEGRLPGTEAVCQSAGRLPIRHAGYEAGKKAGCQFRQEECQIGNHAARKFARQASSPPRKQAGDHAGGQPVRLASRQAGSLQSR
jgi:hypothetical protein